MNASVNRGTALILLPQLQTGEVFRITFASGDDPTLPPPTPVLAAPANGAVNVAVTQALSWGTSGGATAYDVYLGTTNPPATVVAANTTLTTYAPALLPGTTYYWYVAAKSRAGAIPSEVFSFTTQAPPGPSVQAIVDSWDYTAGVAPGAWVTISGTNLTSGAPQTWNLNGTQLPTTLGGATVTFNGTPAALYYVSPTQINALVPASIAPGSVQVAVQANGLNSNLFTIGGTATLPSIYALPTADGSAFFVTAALAGTGTLIGNSAVDPRVTRAALPGDVLDLYMIGLGATADLSKFITNQVFAGAYPVSANVKASIRGEPTQVVFAGLTSPGLYLVRVAIPADIAAGAQPIQIAAGAAQTRSALMLMVGTP
jgi:uncharacterized protein (TIGR03437 family)